MKKQIKKWALRCTVTALLITGLLLVLILNPALTYARKTTHQNYTIFHNKPLHPAWFNQLNKASRLLSTSELYTENLRLDICLNDGSAYPKLIRALRGRAFAWGFYNKVVLQGNAHPENDNIELNGYKWNLAQLLAHEMTHCLQYNYFGFWKSKPIANIPNWKWEGYAEYISRQNNDQQELSNNITRLLATNKNDWAIYFPDSTIAPRTYYEHWMLVQYCMNIKKMNYRQILSDTTGEEAVKKEMFNWYNKIERTNGENR